MTADVSSGATVQAIEIACVTLPLPRPVTLGALHIAEREYLAIRLILANGAEGFAWGYTRGLPLTDAAHRAAQTYLGGSFADNRVLFETALAASQSARCASLLDLALWDAHCTAVRLPLSKVLGQVRTSVPVMPMFGYDPAPERTARQAAAYAEQGFGLVKLMLDGRDLLHDEAIIRAVAEALPTGTQLALDAHWSWTSAEQAMRYIRLAETLDISFLEDAVPADAPAELAALGQQTSLPLAAGENLPGLDMFAATADIASVLRIDATTDGGVAGLQDRMAVAQQRGRIVIPHVFHSLHAHFALANAAVAHVEALLPREGADPIDAFLRAPARITQGQILASTAPGASTRLDWDRLSRQAIMVRV